MYDVIPDNFPIRYPYPPSSSASPPPMDVPYARAIPPDVNERLATRYHNKLSDPRPIVSNAEAGSSVASSDLDKPFLNSGRPALQQRELPSVQSSTTLASVEKGKEKETTALPPVLAVVILCFPDHLYFFADDYFSGWFHTIRSPWAFKFLAHKKRK